MFDKKTRKICWDIIKRYYPQYEDRKKLFIEFLEQYLRPDIILVDLGCGKGDKTICVYKEKVRLSIGLDISESVSKNITIHYPIVGNAYAIPLSNGSVDVIVCQEMIEHLEYPKRFFTEASRVLKSSGILIIMTPNILGWRSIISALMPYKFHIYMNKMLYEVNEDEVFPTYYNANSVWRINKYLDRIGFRRMQQIMYEPTPRTLVFSRITIYMEILLTLILRKYEWLSNFRETIIASYQKK